MFGLEETRFLFVVVEEEIKWTQGHNCWKIPKRRHFKAFSYIVSRMKMKQREKENLSFAEQQGRVEAQ